MATSVRQFAESTTFSLNAEEARSLSDNFDQRPFLFHHTLDEMEIFQMPALLKLAERCMKKRQYKSHYESGDQVVDGSLGNKSSDMNLVQALERIEEGKSWIILKRIHEELEYREALEIFIPALSNLTKTDIHRKYHDPIMTIFITSPNRVTPYHLDGESNFLAQIKGHKSVFLYDANDSYILTAEEKERYWTGHLLAPRWHEELSEGHWHYDISPGVGVFNPATFPHWLKNADNVSISVSINFKRVGDSTIGASRTNYYARKIGFSPAEPGRSPGLDLLKNVTFGKLYEGAHAIRRKLRTDFGI
jgi:hypothetical protein